MKNENKAKRYYWIKLKDNFFTSDTIDYLMSQKNGANYVVLYQMLCLKTVNTNGELSRQIGEIVVPFDAEKIQRDCKFFDIDTIRVALELYKNLGLIFVQDNGILRIENFGNMVGSETLGAIEKREQRKQLAQKVDNEIDKGIDNVYQEKENRDKRLDNRDIDINKENKKEKKTEFDEIIDNYTINEYLKTEIREFIKMRKGLKKPLTSHALELILKNLDKLAPNEDNDKIAILQQSIENSWQGVFQLKNEKQKEDKFQKVYDKIMKEAEEEDERYNLLQIK